MTTSCPCACHGGNGAFTTACDVPGGCHAYHRGGDQPADGLCVLGCADRSRTDMWPRPPRPRAPGLLTCKPCTDRITVTLTEVLELAVNLDLVAASGSVPPSGDTGRKRIKDEPVAPTPVRPNVTALTDVRSRRGTWVPDAPQPPAPHPVDEHGDPVPVDELHNSTAAAEKLLREAIAVFGPRSDQARAAATDLGNARARLRDAEQRGGAQRAVDPRDDAPNSVIGFLDHWTDQVRVGRQMVAAGPCPAFVIEYLQIRTGPRTPRYPDGMLQDWPRTVVCGHATEYRRLVRIDAGARTTGVFAVCTAGHVTRPAGQGDQQLAARGGHGHRPTGIRHALTYLSAVELLERHNDWICGQPWVADYWRQLRELRAELGQAHGEPRPRRIGVCPNGTGQVDEHGVEVVCGTPLSASPYSDSIECPRCGRVWTHREWRFLGRTLGVIA